jgi:hypothetical protein
MTTLIIDELRDLIPDAILMLDAAGAPELAALAVMGMALETAIQKAVAAKGFDLATALEATDEAALAALRIRFPLPK